MILIEKCQAINYTSIKEKIYNQYVKVPVYFKKCNRTYMVRVPCAPGSRKYEPKNILGNSSKAFEFNNL